MTVGLPPRVESAPAPSIRRRPHWAFWRPIVLGTLIVLIIVTGIWLFWSKYGNLGSGDPGGGILHQLSTIRSAIPSAAVIAYANYDEPHIDSCDGNPSTRGWSAVVAQIAFSWTGDPVGLDRDIAGTLTAHGWRTREPFTSFPYGQQWSKQLASGSTAIAMLDANGGTYTLIAQAPPTGKQTSGC